MNLASGLLHGTGTYVHWGVIQISVANLVVIASMLAVFALALFLPFHGPKDHELKGGGKDR